MNLANRDLVTIEDLSNEEINAVFSVADEMAESIKEQSSLCPNLIMATLFYEPSTRTRLSFESAMHRLGGRVISFADMQTSSAAKGESLADTARVVGSYADIIVIRHPWEGAAKVVAEYADVSVINAGDGGHEHPTQTLCDLYTLKEEKGSIKGLSIALWGDLRYGRAVHSLAYGLARFGADIISLPAEGMEMPEYVSEKLQREYNCYLIEGKATDLEEIMGKVDAIYLNSVTPPQLPLFSDADFTRRHRGKEKVKIDALYLTRMQKERHNEASSKSGQGYPVVNSKLLRRAKLKNTLIMHPLPRVDELAYEVDQDPRGIYFKQAAWGVPIRMGLIALLLGVKQVQISGKNSLQRIIYPHYKQGFGVRCLNPNCVSMHETGYIVPEFQIINKRPLRLRCVYCEHEKCPQYIASSKWHQATLENKKYHNSSCFLLDQINLENLIIFDSEKEAQACGFKPSKYATE